MTIDFKIGNAIIEEYEGEVATEYHLTVSSEALDEAPYFLHDDLTRNTNRRSMANSVWSEFYRQHGLTDFGNMLHKDPHTPVAVTQEMVDMFVQARERHEATIGEKVPGWALAKDYKVLADGTVRFYTEEEIDEATIAMNTDADLARLMWFEWWLKWSLENCERSAIEWS